MYSLDIPSLLLLLPYVAMATQLKPSSFQKIDLELQQKSVQAAVEAASTGKAQAVIINEAVQKNKKS